MAMTNTFAETAPRAACSVSKPALATSPFFHFVRRVSRLFGSCWTKCASTKPVTNSSTDLKAESRVQTLIEQSSCEARHRKQPRMSTKPLLDIRAVVVAPEFEALITHDRINERLDQKLVMLRCLRSAGDWSSSLDEIRIADGPFERLLSSH